MFEKKLFNFLFIFIIFLFDRVSKFFIIKLADPLGELNISITSFLNFNLIWNEGIAFGLFSFDQKVYYNSLTIIISFITLILVWFMLNL